MEQEICKNCKRIEEEHTENKSCYMNYGTDLQTILPQLKFEVQEEEEEEKEEKLVYRLIIDGEMKDFNDLDKCLECIKQRKEKLYYCSIRVTKMINIIEEESSSKIKEGDEAK